MSCLVAASTPRVTSNSSSTRASVSSQRAISTFCWLPPERVPTAWLVERPPPMRSCVHDARRPPSRSARAARRTRPPTGATAWPARCCPGWTVAGTGLRPCGPRARRRCRARPGSRPSAGGRSPAGRRRAAAPPLARWAPNRVRNRSRCPWPARPPTPRISPRRRSNETPRSRPPRRSVTRSALSPTGDRR